MDNLIDFKHFQPTLLQENLFDNGMILQFSLPPRVLQKVVYRFLKIRFSRPTIYDVKADGCQALYISRDAAFWLGARDNGIQIPIIDCDTYFGLWFQPGAGPFLSKMTCSDWFNRAVRGDEAPLPNVDQLIERLYCLDCFENQTRVTFDWCTKNIVYEQNAVLQRALFEVHQSCGDIKVSTVAERVGRNSRQLNRLFKRNVGMGSKAFIDIRRAKVAQR